MERLVVASIQQRMRLPRDVDEYREDLRRFMRIAEKKNARLVVFPALAGSLAALPLLTDARSGMAKRADVGQRASASFWDKMVGSIAGTMASTLKVDLRRNLAGLLDVATADVHGIYMELFSRLASEFSMTVVAPSAYLPDPLDGVLRNMSVVFGAGGLTGNGALQEVAVAAEGGAQVYCIGVDSDQWETVPAAHPCLVSSAMKLITPGVGELLTAAQNGEFPGGNYYGGSGLAPFHDFEDSVPQEIKDELAQTKAGLDDGSVTTGYGQ